MIKIDTLNLAFLEEYKRLDKLCCDMYNSEKGITSYIDDLKSISKGQATGCTNYDDDLKHLIKLRRIRNRLSHEVGTLNEKMCTSDDVKWLEAFRKRILASQDPLALAGKKRPAVNKKKDTEHMPDTPGRRWLLYIVALIIIYAVCAIVFIYANNY